MKVKHANESNINFSMPMRSLTIFYIEHILHNTNFSFILWGIDVGNNNVALNAPASQT